MKLIPDWRRVLSRAWSVRLIALAVVLQAVEIAWPYLDGVLPVSRAVFAILTIIISAAAVVARLLLQKEIPNADQ